MLALALFLTVVLIAVSLLWSLGLRSWFHWQVASWRARRIVARYALAGAGAIYAMANTAPNVAAQTVGRLPQTTQGIPAGGPFIRYVEQAHALAYSTAGIAFGGMSNLPLTAVPGFLRALIVKIQASGGTGANVPTLSPDGPYNVISQLTFRDASGQPIFPAIDGFGLYLINLYSGQVADSGDQNPAALPSWSATVVTSGSGAGNFTFKLWVPEEYNSSGYCSLPADNSAELPKLLIQTNGGATVYGTQPSTLPTLTITVEEQYYAVPNNMPDLAPWDVGASCQWLLTTSGQNPPSNAYMRVLDQGVGQFIHTKILVYRDSNNARQDFYPTSIELWIDQFQYRFELNDDRYDIMGQQFSTRFTRPTGVIVYSFRDAVQKKVTTADDGEGTLVTTGSTKFEVGGTWQTNANAPAQLTSYTGMIFPGPTGYPYGSQSH
jgi:hypothetical protein